MFMATKNPNKVIVTIDGESKELVGEELDIYLAQKELDKAEADKIFAAEAKNKLDKEALLQRLGITAEEAKLLLS